MRDGLTRKRRRDSGNDGFATFLEQCQATIIAVSGAASGEQFLLESDCVILGRGPGVDRAFDDPTMSRQHAVIEYADNGFQIRDLGSTNGISVNGKRGQVGLLRHGDRFEIGGHEFQLVIEEREETPNTYVLSSEV